MNMKIKNTLSQDKIDIETLESIYRILSSCQALPISQPRTNESEMSNMNEDPATSAYPWLDQLEKTFFILKENNINNEEIPNKSH